MPFGKDCYRDRGKMDKKYMFMLANHIVGTALSLLMLIFCASNFITGNENLTGINLIIAPNGDPIASTISIAIVFMITVLAVMGIVSFCLLLADFDIIENQKTLDMLVKFQLILALVLVVLTFVTLICLKLKTTELNRGESTQNTLGIGGVINFVFSLVLLAQSFALRYIDKINFEKIK